MTCEEIGAKIRTLREGRGLTQAELAQHLHVSRELINMWERGSRDLKTGAIIDIASFFNVTCDEILTGVEAPHVDAHRKYGLSEQVLARLEQETSERKQAQKDGNRMKEVFLNMSGIPYIVEVVNALLDPETNGDHVLRQMFNYLFFNFQKPLIENDTNFVPFSEFLWFDVHTPSWHGKSPVHTPGNVIEEAFLESVKTSLRDLKAIKDQRRGE